MVVEISVYNHGTDASAGRTVTGATLHKTGSFNDTLSHKSVLDKQRAAIEKLRLQNAKLKEELLLENKFSVRPSNAGSTVLINKLQDEADLYTRKIQLEKRKNLMLEQQLDKTQSKLGTTRQNMGGIFSAKEKSQALQKQIKILENRLEKNYIKYNEAITYNKQLREQIDNLRRERMMFEAINATLERELARIKRDIADVITAANEAHIAKEKALAEVQALKLHAEKEHAQFEEEWKQLTHIIEDDRRQRELNRAQEMAERERRTQELLKSCEASAAQKKKSIRSTWSVGFNKVMAQNVSHEKVRLYGQAFAKIQEATGIQDMDELIKAFVDGEDANYTLFNYVNEVNEEVEKLEDGITAIRKEINECSAQSRMTEGQAAAAAQTATSRLARVESKADAYEQRVDSALSLVESLKGNIWQLFDAIGCNTPAVKALLGDGEMTEANMLSYLGIIEQRSNELLQAFALTKGPDSPVLQELLHVQAAPHPSHRIVIEPPSTQDAVPTGDDGDDDQETLPDDVPLSRAALQAKVARNLDSILERSLKVRPAGATTGAKAGRK
eukprot:jgi/Chrzof1/8657/Cz03g19020.t1